MIPRIYFLVALALTCVFANADSRDAPNIIIILFDDLGYGQLGVTGHPLIKTPNIDQLAEQGVLFRNAYAGSTVCSPSRISLLTGKDAARLHSNANTILLRPGDRTLAHVLGDAGYDTALFGKFGIGTTFGETDPLSMGFDQWVGVLHNVEAHRQYPMFLYKDNEVTFVRENVAGAKGKYAQRMFTDAALSYLDDRANDAPFFVLLTYTAPHAELAVPEEFAKPYRGKFRETPYNGLVGPTPASHFPDYYPEPVNEPNAVQAGMVAALDTYVGEILDRLDAKGLSDNTIVIVSSDNGPHSEGGGAPATQQAAGPFRGGKRDLYEGGIHIPFIVRWPGVIEAGRIEDTPITFADILPTLGSLAGAEDAAASTGANGVSIANLLRDRDAGLQERTLYWEFSRQVGDPNSGAVGVVAQAARRGSLKAVRLEESGPIELYDLALDPGESSDLANDRPGIAAGFAEEFDARLADQED